MMDVETLVNKVKHRLGYPAIDLEIDDDQIKFCLDDALTTIRDYVSTRYYITMLIRPCSGEFPYGWFVDLSEIPDLDEVYDVYIADGYNYPSLYDEFNLVNYARLKSTTDYAIAVGMRSNLEAIMNRSWKRIGNILYVDKYFRAITIEYSKKVIQLTDIEDSYYVDWVYRYTLAASKETLGRIRGKFVVDSNPFKTDASDLLAESKDELSKLREELLGHNLPNMTR